MSRRQRPLLLVAGLGALAAVSVSGCGQGTATRGAVEPPPAGGSAGGKGALQPPSPVECAIATVVEADGRVLAELPLGGADRIEPGTFLRVYDAQDATLLKGMLHIAEVVDAHRSIGRVVGLSDRANPIRPGDRAREVRDLAGMADGSHIERQVRTAQAGHDAAADEQTKRYDGLRDQYQRELAAAQARHNGEIAALKKAHADALARQDEDRRRAVERREAEVKADLAALKATIDERIATAVAGDRRAQDERVRALGGERATLQAQIDNLMTQQQVLMGRLEKAYLDQAEAKKHAAAQVRAEVETRQVLSARLSEVEARSGGRPSPGAVVLSSDPGQTETVLDRLTRVTAEAAIERDRAARAEAEVKTLGQRIATLDQQRAQAESRAATLAHDNARIAPLSDERAALTAQVDQLAQEVKAARESRSAAELARLEAEQALFDLAASVLRLSPTDPATAAIQARIQAQVAERAPAGGETE